MSIQHTINIASSACNSLPNELAGYAAGDAMRNLLQNWRDAQNCDGFSVTSMLGDLEETIAHLGTIKAAIVTQSV